MSTLNTRDVAKLFNRTAMTIFLWRKGTPQLPEPLPAVVKTSDGGRNSVTYVESKVRAWGKRNGLEMRPPFNIGKAPSNVKNAPPSAKRKAEATRPRKTG